MPKYVFSKTLDSAEWNTTVLRDIDEVSALKAQDGGDLALFGGAEIAAALMRHDLIDEYHLFTHPVVLGRGKPLFSPLVQRLPVRLVEAQTFEPGVVLLRHERVLRTIRAGKFGAGARSNLTRPLHANVCTERCESLTGTMMGRMDAAPTSIDAIAPAHRPLFGRIHGLILEEPAP